MTHSFLHDALPIELDTFVPEERLAEKIRKRRKQQQRVDSGPGFFERATRRVSQVSLGQLMLAGLALMLIGWLFDDALGSWSTWVTRSEEHTSELQSLMRISYAVFCLKKKNT